MKIDFTKPGAAAEKESVGAAQQELKQDEPKAEPTAVEQLEAAQHPLKKDQPAELLDPKAIAIQNSAISAAVKEAITPFVGLIDQLSLPQREAFEKAKQIRERNKREWAREKEQMAETKRAERLKQQNCPHLDGNGHSRIQLTHNYPDHQTRGFCNACGAQIHPKEYRCAVPYLAELPPDESLKEAKKFIAELERQGEPQGITPYVDPVKKVVTHFLWPAHPLYGRVQQQEQQASMGVI